MNSPSANGRDFLESLLKWASVAYALGFLTVMVNTVPLGIPTLELIQPVQVWVGVPVAIIFWAVARAYSYLKRRGSDIKNDIEVIRNQMDELQRLCSEKTNEEASALILERVIRDSIVLAIPFARYSTLSTIRIIGLSRAVKFLAKTRSKSKDQNKGNDEKKGLDNYMNALLKTFSMLGRVLIVYRYLSDTLTVIVVLAVALSVYVFWIYPTAPQSWGGGAPMTVNLAIAEDKLPLDTERLKLLLRGTPAESSVAKARLTGPVTLLYSTEHALYIRLDDNSVIRISADAVGGVIFRPGHQRGKTSAP